MPLHIDGFILLKSELR